MEVQKYFKKSHKTILTRKKQTFGCWFAASFIPISFSMDGWYAATQISES